MGYTYTLLNFDNVTKDKDKIIIITLIIINGIIQYIIPFQEGYYIGKFTTAYIPFLWVHLKFMTSKIPFHKWFWGGFMTYRISFSW